MRPRKQPRPDLEEIVPLLIGYWRREMQLAGPRDVLQTREFRSVVSEIQELQAGLFEGESLFESDYFTKKERLGAYTLYHWLLHYQQGLSLINEVPEVPDRVLDVASGPGAFAFAALRHGASEVIAVDQNLAALQWGAQLCGRYGMTLTIRQQKIKEAISSAAGSFDLIIVGHALRELCKTQEERTSLINHLLGRLTPEGHLLIVDSSYPASNRLLLALRDQLVEREIAIRAPCVWRGACPARERSDTPCYAQREMEKPNLIKEIQRAAGINLGSLKMSYLITCAPRAPWPNQTTEPYYRVISPPFESHYGTSFYLCGTEGKKKISGSAPLPHASRAFKDLRRGDLITFEKLSMKAQHYEITPESSLKVVAACGKAWKLANKNGD